MELCQPSSTQHEITTLVFKISTIVRRQYEQYVDERKKCGEWEDEDLFSPMEKFKYLQTITKLSHPPKIHIDWVDSPEFIVDITVTRDVVSNLLDTLPEYEPHPDDHNITYAFEHSTGQLALPTRHGLLLCILNMIIYRMLQKFACKINGNIRTVLERPDELPLISIIPRYFPRAANGSESFFRTDSIHNAWTSFLVQHNNILD